MKPIAVLLLAAGESSRLGQPKQLLAWGEKTLLQHGCETALAFDGLGVTVVLGANAEAIKPTIHHLAVEIVINENWAMGMGNSLAYGMAQVPATADAVLLMLCDQPFVTVGLLEKLMEQRQKTQQTIVASAYSGTFGPPAIFDRKLFPDLLRLHGQQGAKKVMQQHRTEIAFVDFPEGAIDVDTPDDAQRLLSGRFTK